MARGSATRLAYVRHKSVVVEIDVVETEIAPSAWQDQNANAPSKCPASSRLRPAEFVSCICLDALIQTYPRRQ
jgi:hypothetical protein